mgnify:CR=1 FL=1
MLVGAFASLAHTAAAGGAAFEAWKLEFHKSYATAQREAAAAAAYSANDARIVEHNRGISSYTLGHNAFSDMTSEEFRLAHVGGYDGAARSEQRSYDMTLLSESASLRAVNASLDWVARGAVTPIKNQELCGSCWAFSTVGSVEGAFAIAGHPLVALSMQQLVSCDHPQNDGCNGGLMADAFKWIETNPLCTYDDYPYGSGTGVSGACSTACTGVVSITGFTDVPGENGMLAAISKGPVSVAIEANEDVFHLYKSGVIDDASCGKNLDHGVLAVGFGNDPTTGLAYYKVKNSWGSTWGESGYVRLVRGKDQCGVADSASFPTGVTNSTPAAPTPAPGPPPVVYAVAALPSGSMANDEFAVQGDVSSALNGAVICLNGGQYTITKALAVSGMTTCYLYEATVRQIAAVGTTFIVGDCP